MSSDESNPTPLKVLIPALLSRDQKPVLSERFFSLIDLNAELPAAKHMPA